MPAFAWMTEKNFIYRGKWKMKKYVLIVIMTIFVLTGCLGHSSDSNTNDIESKNNDVLKSTQEIRDELKDVPYRIWQMENMV